MSPDSEKLVAERLVPENTSKSVTTKQKQVIGAGIVIVAVVIIAVVWTVGPQFGRVTTPLPEMKMGGNKTTEQTESSVTSPESKVMVPTVVTTIVTTVENAGEERPAEITKEKIVLNAPAPASLLNSDAQVLLAVADFAPSLGKWLLPSDQLRKWVMTVDLMADGKVPKRYRPVDFPIGKFMIEQNKGVRQMSAANYQRMQPIIDVITSTDPKKLSQYYRQWLPLLETAYRELGKKGSFDERFRLAIKHALASDPLGKNPALIRPSVVYQYAEESLEQASDVEKLLWRMGSGNSESIQFFLRELRFYIDEK